MSKRRPPRTAASTKAAPAKRRDPTYDDILAIARLIESGSRFSEFRLRSGDIEVEVKRANGASVPPAETGARSPAWQASPTATEPAANSGSWAPASAGATKEAGVTKGTGATRGTGAAGDAGVAAGDEIIRSPMVGTFYRSPEPGARPFVEPGSRVEPATIVCIIEVMKLMNSIAAGVCGTVTHVFAENGQMVEPGQPLIAIRVDA